MSDPGEFELKLKVWARIQDGTASPEEHSLAMSWGEQSRADYFATASLHHKWMMQHGEEILKCWPFPANQNANADYPLEQILLFAVKYGKSDIENGCLDQFFGNHTGDFAPEVELQDHAEGPKSFCRRRHPSCYALSPGFTDATTSRCPICTNGHIRTIVG